MKNLKNLDVQLAQGSIIERYPSQPLSLAPKFQDKSAQPRQTLHSSIPYSTFGKAVVSTNLDQDETMDLVVGAPGIDDKGCIYIFLGNITIIIIFINAYSFECSSNNFTKTLFFNN